DLRDERVQAALGELKQLEAVKVRYAPPDLSETFSALRSVQSRAGRSGADARGAAAPAPASAPAEAPVATAETPTSAAQGAATQPAAAEAQPAAPAEQAPAGSVTDAAAPAASQ
ncbi:MAG: hypothetical protein JNL20_05135, partial [Thauera sp.]|nr:hypothetical protein [Thauera sp.]